MRQLGTALPLVLTLAMAANLQAANISGEYLEARTCNVYTGPCFANAEMGLAGKEALMAWKIDKGQWKGEFAHLGNHTDLPAEDSLVRSMILGHHLCSPRKGIRIHGSRSQFRHIFP